MEPAALSTSAHYFLLPSFLPELPILRAHTQGTGLSEISGIPMVPFVVARISRTTTAFRFVDGLDSMEGLAVAISEQML